MNLSVYPFENGVMGNRIRDFTDFNPDSPYIYSYDDVMGIYFDARGNKISCPYDAATGFANGKALVYDSDNLLCFADEKFNVVSEGFTGVYGVELFGDVFCAFDREKYYFISLCADAPKPVTPAPQIPYLPEKGMQNFKKTNTYTPSVFPDVNESHWFLKNVALAYETGLMYGKENGFEASGNLTVAQVITMAARLHSIYNTGSAHFEQGRVWYQVYVDYCVGAGIIKKGDFGDYNRNATRSEFVRVLSKAIPSFEFEAKNSVRSIPDVSQSHKDSEAIFMFYKAGILAGSNSEHAFFPDSEITRAETAAIITRIIDKTLRLSF